MKERDSLYNVKTRDSLFNLKIEPEVRREFRVAAKLRGATMSGLIHQYIFQVIRETKKEMPDEFNELLAEVVAKEQPAPINQTVPPKNDFIPEGIAHPYVPNTKKGGGRK